MKSYAIYLYSVISLIFSVYLFSYLMFFLWLSYTFSSFIFFPFPILSLFSFILAFSILFYYPFLTISSLSFLIVLLFLPTRFFTFPLFFFTSLLPFLVYKHIRSFFLHNLSPFLFLSYFQRRYLALSLFTFFPYYLLSFHYKCLILNVLEYFFIYPLSILHAISFLITIFWQTNVYLILFADIHLSLWMYSVSYQVMY